MLEQIQKYMIAITKTLSTKFTLHDRHITLEEIFSDTGLLPAIAKRADQLCSLCLGYGLGVRFEEKTDSLLDLQVFFDEVTPNSLRIFCMTDVISEIINNSPTKGVAALDELMYD